eukprot:SAG31_NODE_3256_length_4485_cov_2.283402_2_plen_139_part_00
MHAAPYRGCCSRRPSMILRGRAFVVAGSTISPRRAFSAASRRIAALAWRSASSRSRTRLSNSAYSRSTGEGGRRWARARCARKFASRHQPRHLTLPLLHHLLLFLLIREPQPLHLAEAAAHAARGHHRRCGNVGRFDL